MQNQNLPKLRSLTSDTSEEVLDHLIELSKSENLSNDQRNLLKACVDKLAKPQQTQPELGYWHWDVGTGEVNWSDELYRIFNVSSKTKIELNSYLQFVHPDDVETLKSVLEGAIAKQSNYRLQHRIVTKEGTFVVACFGKVITKDKQVAAVHGTIYKKYTDASRKNFESILVNEVSNICFYIDIKGKIKHVNNTVFEMLDALPKDVVQRDIYELLETDSGKELKNILARIFKEKTTQIHNARLSFISQKMDGKIYPCQVKISGKQSNDGNIENVLVSVKNSEYSGLVEDTDQQKFSGISEEISEFGIVSLNPEYKIQLWNKGAERIFKFVEKDVCNKDFLMFLKSSDIEKLSPEEVFHECLHTGEKAEWYGWMKVKDEADFWGHVIVNPQLNEVGILQSFTLLVRNLSERKFSDARFQSFLELGTDSTVIVDEAGKIFLVNRQTEKVFGYKREELLGKEIDILLPGSYQDSHVILKEAFGSKTSLKTDEKGLELYAKRKNGKVFPVEISLSPIETEKGVLVLTSIRDISLRQENERKLRNAARELNLSYQRLQGIIDSSQDFVAAVDVNYNFIAFNKAFKTYFDKQFGINLQPGENLKTIFSKAPLEKRTLEPYWERAFKGQEFSFELKSESDGKEIFQSITFNSIRDHNKRLLGAAHVIRDITKEFRQREILKRSEEMLNDAQEFARIGSFEYDFKLKEVYCSDAVYELLGITKQKITVDAELLRLVDTSDRKGLSIAFMELIQQGKPFHKRIKIRKIQDGKSAVLSCTARTRITPEGNPGIIGVLQDVTKDYNIQVELEEAKERAEENAKLKQNFVANVSHEIRTPMNAILGFSRFLMEANIGPEDKEFAGNIYSSAENLLVLLDDILDFSKLEAGKVVLTEIDFDLRESINQVLKMFKLKAEQKNLDLYVVENPTLKPAYLGDPYRINQMLVNLVGNAVKFTETGEIKVEVIIEQQTEDTHTLKIAVTDTGIGIPKKKLQSIFQSFSQAEGDTTRKYGGSGLGLSIVKNLLQMLNGRIEVKSEVGKGSTFSLHFPLKYGNYQKLPLNERVDVQQKSGKGFKILLAEDNHNNQIITAKLLRDVGFEVIVAANGQDAVQMFKTNKLDLVLMDIQMPVMDGVEAMQKIKEIEKEKNRSKKVPIVALTAHALIEERERYLAAGMNDYLSKPFKPEMLYQTVFSQIEGIKVKIKIDPTTKPKANKKKKETMWENKQPVDLTFLKEMVGDDQEVVKEMLDIFQEDTPIYLKTIRENLAAENWDSIAKTCHTLKSSIGFMGRTDLVEMAKELQLQKTKPKANDKIREMLNVFVEEIEQVVAFVKSNPNIAFSE